MNPLTKLPGKTDAVLFLIGEELKARKFISLLQKAGFAESDYETHLDSLIMQCIGLDDSDETFAKYTLIMDKRSENLIEERKSITKQALKAYSQLTAMTSKSTH